MSKRSIVICDLDGTLALDKHRAHFLAHKPRKWDEYFALCAHDEPNHTVIQVVNALSWRGKQVYIWTGRREQYEATTRAWLATHGVKYDSLVMRPTGNTTEDYIMKINWLDEYKVRDKVWLVIEDRKRVVDAWRREGLTCLQVADGNF